MTTDDPAAQSWHVDKRVPVALIVALLMQTAAITAYIVRVDARGSENTRRLTILEAQVDPMRQTIPRIEQILLDIQRRLERQERE